MSQKVVKPSILLPVVAAAVVGGAWWFMRVAPQGDAAAEAVRMADRLRAAATSGADPVPADTIAAFERDVLPKCPAGLADETRLVLDAYRYYQADIAHDAERLKELIGFSEKLLARPDLQPDAASSLAVKVFATYSDLLKDFDAALAFASKCKPFPGLGDTFEKPLADKLRSLEPAAAIELLRKVAGYPCFEQADPVARQTQELVKRIRDDKVGKSSASCRDAIAFATELVRKHRLSPDVSGALAVQIFTSLFTDSRDEKAALAFLAGCKAAPSPVMKRGVHREISKKYRELKGPDAVAFLKRISECPWFAQPDYLGQLAGEGFTRFGGDGRDKPAEKEVLKNLLAFANAILPRCSQQGQDELKESLLNGYFLAGDYAGAVSILEKGAPAEKSDSWRKSMVAKLRAHIAMEAGDKPEAIRQLTAFINFMLSDEQKDFDECDPSTGLVYSREWVVGLNYVRCMKMARELKDPKAEEYLALARKYYAVAQDKAKGDAKALEAVKAEMKAAGL